MGVVRRWPVPESRRLAVAKEKQEAGLLKRWEGCMLSVVHKHTRDHARDRAHREKKCRQGRPKFGGRRKNVRAHGWARVTSV